MKNEGKDINSNVKFQAAGRGFEPRLLFRSSAAERAAEKEKYVLN